MLAIWAWLESIFFCDSLLICFQAQLRDATFGRIACRLHEPSATPRTQNPDLLINQTNKKTHTGHAGSLSALSCLLVQFTLFMEGVTRNRFLPCGTRPLREEGGHSCGLGELRALSPGMLLSGFCAEKNIAFPLKFLFENGDNFPKWLFLCEFWVLPTHFTKAMNVDQCLETVGPRCTIEPICSRERKFCDVS